MVYLYGNSCNHEIANGSDELDRNTKLMLLSASQTYVKFKKIFTPQKRIQSSRNITVFNHSVNINHYN
jgi:hypothetical protein